MLSPRRPTDEHQLAGICAGERQRHASHHRARGQQDLPQTPLPEASVSAGTQHHPNNGHGLLLCKYRDSHLTFPSENACLITNSRTNKSFMWVSINFLFLFSRSLICSCCSWFIGRLCALCFRVWWRRGSCQRSTASLRVSEHFYTHFFFFFKKLTFYYQGCIKLIKSDSKDIFILLQKNSISKKILSFWTLWSSKNPEKKRVLRFLQKYEAAQLFQHW